MMPLFSLLPERYLCDRILPRGDACWRGWIIPLAATPGLLGGCVSSTSSAETPRELQGMPNPSVKKCLEDGYQIEDILTNGIPRGSYCVDAQSGKKCEVWAYFRGECRLPPASTNKK